MVFLKKLFICFLVLTSAVALAACGKDKKTTKTTTTTGTTTVEKVINADLYVSPTGSDENEGTQESPLNLQKAIMLLQPGKTIYLLPGEYKFSTRINIPEANGGTPNAYKTLKPYSDRVELNFGLQTPSGSNCGIRLDADYWKIESIDISNAKDNGLFITGSYNIIDDCTFFNNGDTGCQLGRASSGQNEPLDEHWPSYNQILNCSSFNNADTTGENADGFACKLTTGPGNVFDGCMAFNNIDDGWDLFTKDLNRPEPGQGKIYPVTIKNCVAFNNGFTIVKNNGVNIAYATSESDGNGFKLGGDDVEVAHYVENCIAFNNIAHGFTDNSNPGTISLVNCTSFDNGIGNILDFPVYSRTFVEVDDETQELIFNYTANTLSTYGNKNNFDLARHKPGATSRYDSTKYITSNNVFSGCLSLNNRAKTNDAYRGNAKYSLFATSSGWNYYQVVNICDSAIEAYAGLEAAGIDRNSLFVSITVPDVFQDSVRNNLHKSWRNDDGSINMGDFLKVNQSALTALFGEVKIGANLHN